MSEGEGPRPPQAETKLGPNPITHTPDGRLRRRNDPHGLTRGERAEVYLMRAGRRVEEWFERNTSPRQADQIPTSEATQPESAPREPQEPPITTPQITVNGLPITHEALQVEEDPLRFGSDVPSSTIRVMRALNWIGEFFQQRVITPILGAPSHQPMARRPRYQYPHEMKVQRATGAPSSVNVVKPAQELPYDWNDPKRGAPEFQDNPVIDTTESTPNSTSSK